MLANLKRGVLPSALLVAVLLLSYLVAAGGLQLLADAVVPAEPGEGGPATPGRPRPEPDFSEPITLLMTGVDHGQRGKEPPNVDTIILFRFDPATGEAVGLSIPRDTIVFIPKLGWGKMSHSYYFGGAEMTRAAVEHFTGVPVHYSVEISFEGMVKLVDALGGITLEVDRPISHEWVSLEPGVQRLTGWQALIFVRFRNEAMGDIARVQRQQRFLMVFLERLRQEESRRNLAALLPALYRCVKTDIPLPRLMDFYFTFREMDHLENLRFATVPGSFYQWAQMSCWRADLEASDALMRELFGDLTAGVGFKRYAVLEYYEKTQKE